jgi:hypothetical protein
MFSESRGKKKEAAESIGVVGPVAASCSNSALKGGKCADDHASYVGRTSQRNGISAANKTGTPLAVENVCPTAAAAPASNAARSPPMR